MLCSSYVRTLLIVCKSSKVSVTFRSCTSVHPHRSHGPPCLLRRVTGKGYMDVNRISGYIPGKIVFFLMQVCFHERRRVSLCC